MKKFVVIGNPINHSLSPMVHKYWFGKYNEKATYEKKSLEEKDLIKIIQDIKRDKMTGANITVPFKQKIIPFLDELSFTAKETCSVNTVYKINNKIIGDNTDVMGFQKSLRESFLKKSIKSILLIGAGGVTPSIIYALKKMDADQIFISNRTKDKALVLKDKFGPLLTIVPWENLANKKFHTDLVINCTSLGLNKTENIDLNFPTFDKNTVFYDVIYNPNKTLFLQKAEKYGYQTINGMMMFLYQAQLAYEIWNGLKPEIDSRILDLVQKNLL